MANIRLLIRTDDAGSCWASNVGCLKACTEGIARSIEVMMPCAWVEHMAHLLKPHPGIDVGIHLTLTSEWDAVRWRPLTRAESLVDEDGYFRPQLKPRARDDRPSLMESRWTIDDIAAELRAQIRLGLAKFPGASHVSSHMTPHFRHIDPSIGALVAELCHEFGLKDDPLADTIPSFGAYPKYPLDPAARIESLVRGLRALEGGTWFFVDHPAVATPELQATGHVGYEDVGPDRSSCLDVLTSPAARRAVAELDIELISYREI